MAQIISRRRAISNIGIGVVIATNLSSCCRIKKFFGNPCDSLEEWKKESKKWWKNRKRKRERQRHEDINSGIRKDIQIPYPYLVCWRTEFSEHGTIADQLSNFTLNQQGDLYVIIENRGNVPSWFTVVEIFETPYASYNMKFSEFKMNDRIVVSINPGQLRTVKLRFTPTRATNGGIVIRSYDPFNDHMGPSYLQMDRHNNGVGWDIFNP